MGNNKLRHLVCSLNLRGRTLRRPTPYTNVAKLTARQIRDIRELGRVLANATEYERQWVANNLD